jgi:hypothetical protein
MQYPHFAYATSKLAYSLLNLLLVPIIPVFGNSMETCILYGTTRSLEIISTLLALQTILHQLLALYLIRKDLSLDHI